MNAMWDTWKRGFDAWEGATAKYLESVLKSPLVLEPAGAALSAVMKAKSARDKAVSQAWAALGLPTRRDQERILHLLNRLESRMIDLEDAIAADDPAPSPAPRRKKTKKSRE